MRTLFLILFLFQVPAFSQQYPRWFLYQGEVNCRPNAAAIVGASTFYRDSAVAGGFRSACTLQAKYFQMAVTGGQAFWGTEGGTFAIGSEYAERYDSSLVDLFLSRFHVLASFGDKQQMIVLAGDRECELSDEMRESVSLNTIQQPSWIESLPEQEGYIYGAGMSQEYFYEQSSWQSAEKNSYMSIARSIGIRVKGMQKQDSAEHQDVRDEELNAVMHQVEVIARWRDTADKVFYVLSRAKK
ncbi:MAG: LPP20 family lipoprotein [Bacteroidota bacterium]|jgi:hypothetical protein